MFFIFFFFYTKVICSFFFKKLFLSTLLFFTVFWFYSIFIYIYSSSRSSRFLSSYIRFWRRSYLLFWVIEIYLFFIYVYLVLNCPVETEWLADQTQLFYSGSTKVNFLIKNIFSCIVVLLFLRNSGFSNFSYIIDFKSNFVFFIFLLLFLDESYQFLSTCLGLSYDFENYSFLERVWECSNSKHPSLISHQYCFLVSFLKFWHILFIFFFFLLDLLSLNLDNYSRPRSVKYSLNNVVFFIIFCNTQLLLPLKFFLNSVFYNPYTLFFTDFSYFYLLCM